MKLLNLGFLLIPAFCFSQTDTLPINKENGKIEFTEVINVDSASEDKLYSNAKIFIANEFRSGKDVTQLNDDNTKYVSGNANILITFKGIGLAAVDKRVKFSFDIQSKNERYKYSFREFFFTMDNEYTIPLEDDKKLRRYLTKNQYLQMVQQVDSEIKTVISDMKKYMSSQTEATKEW